MNQDYINNPALLKRDFVRHLILSAIIEFFIVLFLAARIAQVIIPDLQWLRELVPPVADLIFLALLLFLCFKTFKFWTKVANHPKRLRILFGLGYSLLTSWFFFICGVYAEKVIPWLNTLH